MSYRHKQWLEDEFCGYLKKWEQSVDKKRKEEQFKKKEVNRMLLSLETRNGLQITGKATVFISKQFLCVIF